MIGLLLVYILCPQFSMGFSQARWYDTKIKFLFYSILFYSVCCEAARYELKMFASVIARCKRRCLHEKEFEHTQGNVTDQVHSSC